MDPLPHQCGMDKTKREELEKAYKKEKNPMVAARMLVVHMVHIRKKSVSATVADLIRADKWVYDWLKRLDAGGLDGLRDLPKSGRPASVPRTTMDRIIDKASQSRRTPKELQECNDGYSHAVHLTCNVAYFAGVGKYLTTRGWLSHAPVPPATIRSTSPRNHATCQSLLS